MSSVRKTGDWAMARRLLAGGPVKLKAAVGTALRQEAHLLRKEIVQGITRQAPGGESIKPPSPLTLAARQMKGRGGTKALMVSGDLRNGIAAIVKGDEAFVGVPRKARGKDGTKRKSRRITSSGRYFKVAVWSYDTKIIWRQTAGRCAGGKGR